MTEELKEMSLVLEEFDSKFTEKEQEVKALQVKIDKYEESNTLLYKEKAQIRTEMEELRVKYQVETEQLKKAKDELES